MAPQLTHIRRSFSIQEKREKVCLVHALTSKGHSHSHACSCVGISRKYFGRWEKTIKQVDQLLEVGDYVPYNITGSAKRVSKGRPSILLPIKEELEEFIQKFRDQGVQLTNHMVMREASRLLPAFAEKSFHAKEQAQTRHPSDPSGCIS
jgi:hypothetical protein